MFKHFRILVMAIMAMAFVGLVAAQEDEGLTLETITGTDEYYGQNVTLEGHVREFISPRIFVLSEGAALDDDAVLVVNLSSNIDSNIYKGAQASVSGTVQPSLNYVLDNSVPVPVYGEDIISVDPSNTAGDTDMSGGMEAVPDDMETETPEDMDMEPTVEGMEPTVEGTDDTMEVTPADMEVTPEATMETTDDMDTSDDMATTEVMSTTMMNPQDVVGLVYSGELPDDYDVYTVVFVTDGASISWLPQPE